MPVGAIIGVGALTAGTQLIGAKVASNASKKAAQIQVDASSKALALQKSIYDEQVKRTQPYVDAGATSMKNLMSQYWGTPYGTQLSNAVSAGKASVGIPGVLGSLAPATAPQMGAPAPPPSPNPGGGPVPPGYGAPAPSRKVLMRAPTGETASVDEALVQAFLAKGATVLTPGGGPRADVGGTLGAVARGGVIQRAG